MPTPPLPYRQPPRYQAQFRPRVSSLAVWSLICGLFSWCGLLPGILAAVFGHVGRSTIRKSNGALTGSDLCMAGLVMGYIGIAAWVVFFTLIFFTANGSFNGYFEKFQKFVKEASTETSGLFPISETPVPDFPPLPKFEFVPGTEVRVAQITLKPSGKSGPGTQMSLRVYLPKGADSPRSLSCVFVAPAGTNMLTGSDIDELDSHSYHDECLPYAKAGMAVVHYSIDGAIDEKKQGDDSFAAIKGPFSKFKAAAAGVINARNALEFALAQLPMLDPDRLYAAGHSSAGTLALLFTEHEPRLRACLAYAPVGDVHAHFKKLLTNSAKESGEESLSFETISSSMNFVLPGFSQFIKRSSPSTHLDHLTVPVFLFQAQDDQTVTFDDAKAFADAFKAKSDQVDFVTVPEGGHYESMIDQGVPQGIAWIRKLEQSAGR